MSAEKKQVSSTAGMQTSVQTSSLMAYRTATVVPQRMLEMERAITDRDFQTFARLTMQVLNIESRCSTSLVPRLHFRRAESGWSLGTRLYNISIMSFLCCICMGSVYKQVISLILTTGCLLLLLCIILCLHRTVTNSMLFVWTRTLLFST